GLDESTALQADCLTVRFTPAGAGTLEKVIRVSVVHLDMAVDGNRDRAIKFQDPEDEEVLFWVNNDFEDNTCVDVQTKPAKCEEDDLETDLEDARDNRIRTRRDLEDFSRLQIVSGLLGVSESLTMNLRIDADAGSPLPTVNLFRAVDASDKYLGFELSDTDQQPDQQLLELRLAQVAAEPTPLSMEWLEPGAVSPFLFEGQSAGQGNLVVTVSRLGVPVLEKRIHLNLHDISWFYDYFAVEAADNWLLPVASELNTVQEGAYRPEQDDYVLFVHGWNTEDFTRRRWTETIFKRLWWQGYQGKVGLFDWPCRTLPSWDMVTNYDKSEYRAWHSASVLAELLTDNDLAIGGRHAGRVRLLAHSQGNVVAGEAINLAPAGIIHTYVASQAALSASFYHQVTSEIEPQLTPFSYETPEVFAYYPGAELLTPYLAEVPQKVQAGRMYSYYNLLDYALTNADAIWPAWEFNNTTRPDNSIGYRYSGSPEAYPSSPDPGEGFFQVIYDTDPVTGDIVNVGSRDLRFPRDRYEIFSFGAESRTKALGAAFPPPAVHPGSKDLAQYGYDKELYSHSRQFRSNIVDEMRYWSGFVNDADFSLEVTP
ncbi:MAG TPA: hypothetical protein VJ910_15010, partial [Desulfuromonadales bacterium]|nr:hypothetical protein [Desulfuromonadales bacterium]